RLGLVDQVAAQEEVHAVARSGPRVTHQPGDLARPDRRRRPAELHGRERDVPVAGYLARRGVGITDRRNVRRVLERYQRAGDPAPGLRRGDRARRADGQRERIPRLTLEVLVEQGLARVVRGEGIVGRGAEPGPQRDQAGQPRDPCEQGEPPVAVAGAAERAQHARSGARAASARGTGEGTRGVRHIKLLRAGGVLALRYSPPAARGKSRAGRHFGRPGTPPEYSPGSTADLAAGR